MKITVSGAEKIQARLSRYENLDDKLRQIAERLCQIGEPIIRAVHGNHASVRTEQTPSGYKIVAEGESVLFIEFGTGDSAGIHASAYDAVPDVVRPGSWSETHAHQYEMLGFWFWHGQKFNETAPHPAFYDAYRAMVESLPQVVNEVFK